MAARNLPFLPSIPPLSPIFCHLPQSFFENMEKQRMNLQAMASHSTTLSEFEPFSSVDTNGTMDEKTWKRQDMTTLKFGIESILRPEFGTNANVWPPNGAEQWKSMGLVNCNRSPADISAFLQSPPSNDLCWPTPTSNKLLTAVNSPAASNEILPSWIFCTRYSDRPSSGRN